MPSLSDDFQMPIMYKDLRDSNLGMLPGMMPGMGFGYYTNFLGGIRMPRELSRDEVVLKNRNIKEAGTLKKVGLVLLALGSAFVLKQKGAFKWVSKQASGVKNWFGSLFKSKPKTPAATPAP